VKPTEKVSRSRQPSSSSTSAQPSVPRAQKKVARVSITSLTEDAMEISDLTPREIEFASNTNLRLKQYAFLKHQMETAFNLYGYFNKTAAREYVKGVNVVNLGKTWEFCVEIGVIRR
jgi:hypothetical protein